VGGLAAFYTFAAKVMRLILIDHARETQAPMQGGGHERVPLSDDLTWINIDSPELLDLNRVLEHLNHRAKDAGGDRQTQLD